MANSSEAKNCCTLLPLRELQAGIDLMKKVAIGLEGSKRLGVVKDRCIETPVSMQSASLDTIYYQHTVLCQTCMPYRNPGDDVRVWNREQGDVALNIEAGMARQPETKRWIQLGLPFGPKARLILAYLNAEALRTGTPEIDVERSLTAFVRRIQDPTRCGICCDDSSGHENREV